MSTIWEHIFKQNFEIIIKDVFLEFLNFQLKLQVLGVLAHLTKNGI